MKRWMLILWLVSGLLIATVWHGTGAQRGKPFNRQASKLMSSLLRDHFYALTSEQQTNLMKLHRRLKEMEVALSDRAFDPKVLRELAGMAKESLTQLRGSPWMIPLSISDGAIQGSAPGEISMPGDSGLLLFRVDAGGETDKEDKYLPLEHDMSQTSMKPILVELKGDGVHWVFVGLKKLPFKGSALVVDFRKDGKKVGRIPVEIQTPDPGRLSVEILSDDTGQPVPAMVQLVWKTDGRDRKPGNVIDMEAQFDRQGRPSARRRAVLPGDLGGHWWWCVPGPFDMALPPGEWEIMVRRGLEHVPARETFSVQSGKLTSKTLRPKRWVDMPKHGWYSGDDHLHGQILSDQDAKNLMAWIQAEDVHLANVVKMGDVSRTYFDQRGFGKDYRVQNGDYILSPGQECPRTHQQLGHTIHMNTTSMVRDTEKYYLYDWVFDNVHAQGGLSGYCHVVNNSFHVHRDMSMNVAKGKVDFVEVLQFNRLGTDTYYDFLNNGFKLTASAGSDVPWGGTTGEVRLFAYVGSGAFSAEAWFEAVRRGRTFVSNGPMIELRINDALPGDEVKIPLDRGEQQIHITAKAWGAPGRMLPTELQIIQHGDVLRSVKPTKDQQTALSLDFSVDAGFGSWIAARANGSDGSAAHTTPIYVVRDPVRWWKYEDAERLIGERLASVAEIEDIVAKAQAQNAEGKIDDRRDLKQLALQGPQLLERVESAREIYASLQEQLKKEANLRGEQRIQTKDGGAGQ